MNQTITGILVVVCFSTAAFIGGYLWRGTGVVDPVPTSSMSARPAATSVAPVPTTAPQLHSVSLTEGGPSLKTLTVNLGDAVRFRNASSPAFWPASDPHPSHAQCPWLDAGRGLKTGEEYTVVMTSVATCTYHNHLDPSNDAMRGTIIVR